MAGSEANSTSVWKEKVDYVYMGYSVTSVLDVKYKSKELSKPQNWTHLPCTENLYLTGRLG